jgi:glycine reductase complex component B subunit gamma
MTTRIVHYINQFYGGIGGEEAASSPLLIREGPVGPGLALKKELGDGFEIVMTLVCGDNYFNDHSEQVIDDICRAVSGKADLLLAGPAFNAGRYGVACGTIGKSVAAKIRIPVVAGMYPENPAVEMCKRELLIVATGASAAGMKEAATNMARLAKKIANKEELLPAREEGYVPRGIRLNQVAEKPAALRAVDLLKKKLRGEPFVTEVAVQQYDKVTPAKPIGDLSKALIALVTEAGIVPFGNPDKIRHANAINWASYSLEGVYDLKEGQYEGVHGGFDASFANKDPDRVLPVDALRHFEKDGYIGKLYEKYYVTVGNGTTIAMARKFGEAIAKELLAARVQGVLVPAS